MANLLIKEILVRLNNIRDDDKNLMKDVTNFLSCSNQKSLLKLSIEKDMEEVALKLIDSKFFANILQLESTMTQKGSKTSFRVAIEKKWTEGIHQMLKNPHFIMTDFDNEGIDHVINLAIKSGNESLALEILDWKFIRNLDYVYDVAIEYKCDKLLLKLMTKFTNHLRIRDYFPSKDFGKYATITERINERDKVINSDKSLLIKLIDKGMIECIKYLCIEEDKIKSQVPSSLLKITSPPTSPTSLTSSPSSVKKMKSKTIGFYHENEALYALEKGNEELGLYLMKKGGYLNHQNLEIKEKMINLAQKYNFKQVIDELQLILESS